MLCFFDIDGTLVGFGRNEMIPSTVTALKEAKRAGHRLFICTGRSVKQIPDWLKTDLFDGIVASAGAHVLYHGSEIYFRAMNPETIRQSVQLFAGNTIPYMLQGYKQNYIEKRFYSMLVEALAAKGNFPLEKVEKLFGGCVLTEGRPEAEIAASGDAILSMLYEKAPFDHKTMSEKLGPELKVNPSSFNKPDPYSGEITQTKITKASGIRTVMDHLGLPREETAAFGDGHNDIEMLQFAGTSVAMGDSPNIVKASADLVAPPLEADGLYHAMRQIGLM